MKIKKIAIIIVTSGVQSKDLQPLTAMFVEDKVTEFFYLADEFCKYFDAQQEKSMLTAPQDEKDAAYKPTGLTRMAEPLP